MMRTKEQYYEEVVLKNRELAADPEVTKCPCPNGLCDWHGKCRECVALHRYHGDHVPYCLQPLLREKIRALAQTVEMELEHKPPTPLEYRHYVRKRDAEAKNTEDEQQNT
ncbi:MAG: hypothetical protein GX316_05605 [Firmicutes bacterium]|nr:hypothetical protein [Bacillota bacterium]